MPENGQDGSVHSGMFILTHLSEPIALSEYTALIANGSSTHAILCYDWDPTKDPMIKYWHVDPESDFHEMVLQNRPGCQRLSFLPNCNINQIHQALSYAKDRQLQKVFQMPSYFKQTD